MKSIRFAFALAFLAAIGLVGAFAQAATPPAPPAIAGLTAEDKLPNGCVSCHVKVSADKDYSISAELKRVKGHPDVSKIVKSVPDGCLVCHDKAGSKIPFNKVIHNVHLSKNSYYLVEFQGNCLNCHNYNADTGMGFKKGPFS